MTLVWNEKRHYFWARVAVPSGYSNILIARAAPGHDE